MYRVDESLVAHVDGISVMNHNLRSRENMATVRFIDGEDALKRICTPPSISVSIATIPERQRSLEKVVSRLLPQVDQIRIYLNNYSHIPEFLHQPGIKIATSTRHGNLSDAGKFFWDCPANGYLLTCDDDILYPPDYVSRLISTIERYKRRAVIGYHGVLLKSKVYSYYKDRTVFHFTQGLDSDRYVHIVGTGCCAWHSSSVDLCLDDFKTPDMADIWFGLTCQQQQIPMITPKRNKGWLTPLESGDTIYRRHKNSDSKQTQVINNVKKWCLYQITEESKQPLLDN